MRRRLIPTCGKYPPEIKPKCWYHCFNTFELLLTFLSFQIVSRTHLATDAPRAFLHLWSHSYVFFSLYPFSDCCQQPAIFPSYRPGISSRIVFDLSFSPRLYLLNPIELQNPSLIFAISIGPSSFQSPLTAVTVSAAAFQVFNGFCAREGQCYYGCMARSEVASTYLTQNHLYWLDWCL
jgi:hypothetical protein